MFGGCLFELLLFLLYLSFFSNLLPVAVDMTRNKINFTDKGQDNICSFHLQVEMADFFFIFIGLFTSTDGIAATLTLFNNNLKTLHLRCWTAVVVVVVAVDLLTWKYYFLIEMLELEPEKNDLLFPNRFGTFHHHDNNRKQQQL